MVNDAITVADAEAQRQAVGGRAAPLLWDNYPVNDGLMTDRLFLGPLCGREPGLAEACARLPGQPDGPADGLAPAAGVDRRRSCGGRPLAEWQATAADLELARRSPARSTPAPRTRRSRPRLAGDRGPARGLLHRGGRLQGPGLEEEAQDWLDQVHRDAGLALSALSVLDGEVGFEGLIGLAILWRTARRAKARRSGTACSIRPVIGQAADGTWAFDPSSVTYDDNAVDDLLQAALSSQPTVA